MSPRKRERKSESEISYLKIPDISKPPSDDGIQDYTIISLDTETSRSREIDRISQMAREGVYRKNLLLLRKERNLINAVQHEQLGNFEYSIACYERAAILAERLELFEESKLYRDKLKSLNKNKRSIAGKKSKKKRKSRGSSQYSPQELATKAILPKGITIPIVDKETAEKFKESRTGPEEEDEDLF